MTSFTPFRVALTSLLVATALAGCSTAQFATANSIFTATKKGASTFSNAALPAAAIATSLGALELVKALSSSSKLIASGAGNLTSNSAAGANSNIISTGAGNFGPHFALAAVNSTDTDVVNAASKVKMHATYSSVTTGNTTDSEISSFKGTTQGYAIDAHGKFSYTLAGSGGSIACSMAGAVTYGSTALTIKELKFATSDPLPSANAELGSFIFQQTEGATVKSAIDAKLTIDANGKIAATGTYTDASKKTSPINFSQDKPTGDAVDSTVTSDASN